MFDFVRAIFGGYDGEEGKQLIQALPKHMTLADYITSHLATPFEWGKHDCVLFSAGWVRQATGDDPLSGLSRWGNEFEALRAIRRAGGLESALDARYRRINPNLANDGDWALYNGAVCLFSGAYIVGPNMSGLVFVDRMEAQCAWSY